jgi:5-methylthioadenosine/S-adenosylhomocysteine deaminase
MIRASHIVAYQDGDHRYLRNGVVVIEGNTVTYVGRQFVGEADEIIDATDKIVTPELISCHAHLAGSPLDKSFIEDVRPRNSYLSRCLTCYLPGPRLRTRIAHEPASTFRWPN